ncbi:polysaccharide deacetylase family protein [Bacillus sp. BRMEA1]|uniref:polysaccharide deacetylase family protein n=1 Tax=Neobacillus endophyticus TaxID=2738405 RepID=UPI001565005F|nr:polysaccharide deacetylase family protein [Neobacillus endophyticus]NRD76464.1 polysaccharide deacetylase family protein [Neobacillus endophyticus]
MKRKVVLLISAIILIGLVVFGCIEFQKYNHIRSLKNKKPKAIVVKNLNANIQRYYMTNKNNVPIYESLDGKLMAVATLSNGQEINSKEDYDHKWVVVRIGNNDGIISKNDVVLSTKGQHSDDDQIKNPIVKYYNTLDNTPIYSNYRGHEVPIASLLKKERYPMLDFDKNWLMFDIAGKIGYVKRTGVKLDYGIPVLTYHHFLENRENKLFRTSGTTITPETFDQQMGYLHNKNFTPITTGDLENYLNGKIILPENTVLITFDDGLQSVYRYAYPILKKYNLKATEFMITERIAKTPYAWNPNKVDTLSYPEMDQMKDIFEFQSHTNNLHSYYKNKTSDVVALPYNIVKSDIALSQKIVHAQSFAYPFGQYNSRAIQILKELGFKSAFTTTEGYAKMGVNPYLIPRFIITPKISLTLFKYLVS